MKNKYLFASLFLSLFFITACETEDIPPIGEPSDKMEGINDEFVLDQVIFFDNVTPFDDNSLDVSDTYIGAEPLTISFDKEQASYDVTAGSSINLFGESGIWSFDDPKYPSTITFKPNDGQLFTTSLLRTIRPQDEQLQISIAGGCDKTSVTYELYFNRK
jgi:hypothetical protein